MAARVRAGAGVIGEAVPHPEPLRDLAACDGQPPALWDDVTDAGRRVCAGCPVRSECLEAAMLFEADAEPGDRGGLWGALTPGDRTALQLFRDTAAELGGLEPLQPVRADFARCARCPNEAPDGARLCEPCRRADAAARRAAQRARAREAS